MGVIQAGNDSIFHVQGFVIRISQIQSVTPVRRRVGWKNEVYYDFDVLLRNLRYPNKAFVLHYPSKFEALVVHAAIRAAWFERMESEPQDKGYRVIW